MALQLYDLDAAATRAVNSLVGASASVDFLMIWVSAIGVPLLVPAVAAQWWRGSDRPHNRHVLVATGLSFLLGLAINQLILLFVHRMRPYDSGISHLLISPSADPSFPSDHATATFAIAAAFLLHGMRRTGRWFLAAAVLVAVSRVYIGTHYVSDVLGGAATGIVAAILVRALYREGTRLDRFVTSVL
ncbi:MULTISPECIES: phosphatase PAP2 family protein [Brucella/Ochrobactrum group]|nr:MULTISPECIES: phosphatase PAP2 family protein [Brucella/Ochrobactrum group]